MPADNILLDNPEDGIYLLTVNRPKQLNALNQQTLEEIRSTALQLGTTTDTRVLIVTGAGDKSFIAGADIKQMWEKNAREGQQFSTLGLSTVQALSDLSFPVIAAVNGYALGGGCELALACDWIIASENAQFGQPEVKLGLIPGFGGTQRLPRYIGRPRAKELTYTGRHINAALAKEWGLVNEVYDDIPSMLEAAKSLHKEMQKNSSYAVAAAKKAINEAVDLEMNEALKVELDQFEVTFASEDKKVGVQAFLNKEKPAFKGC